MQIIQIWDILLKMLAPTLLVLFFILLGSIARRAFNWYVVAWARRTEVRLDDIIVDAVNRPLMLWFALFGLLVATPMLGLPIWMADWMVRIITAIVILSVIYVISKIGVDALQEYVGESEDFRHVVKPGQKLLKTVAYTVGALIVLGYLEAPTLITFIAGVTGLVLIVRFLPRLGTLRDIMVEEFSDRITLRILDMAKELAFKGDYSEAVNLALEGNKEQLVLAVRESLRSDPRVKVWARLPFGKTILTNTSDAITTVILDTISSEQLNVIINSVIEDVAEEMKADVRKRKWLEQIKVNIEEEEGRKTKEEW